MRFSEEEKQALKRELGERFADQPEVRRVVVFGSFIYIPDPHDLDVAVFQDSDEGYLPLAMRYRRLTRSIARRIPMDIVPIRPGVRFGGENGAAAGAGKDGWFLDEIIRGEVVYEG